MTKQAAAGPMLSALIQRRSSPARALLLVAHPDDEILGASVVLQSFSHLRLVYGTDGSGGDAEVTAARFAELATALARLGVAPTITPCDFPDGVLIAHAAALAQKLEQWLPETDVLITHAFEGGHPDHDACAVAAQIACERAADPVVRLEFAIYSRLNGQVGTNAFPATETATVLTLSPEEQAHKRQALDAFTSQRHVVDRFPLAREALRVAPLHDLGEPRDPAALLFAFTEHRREAEWRLAALQALRG